LTPKNYTRPVALPTVESSLQGAIYDPYVRRIVWEGLGSDQVSGRWGSEADSWLKCPRPRKSAVDTPWPLQVLQEILAPRKPKPGPGSGPPLTSDTATVCPYAWGAPIHKLNCEIVWPPVLDNPDPDEDYPHLDTPEYSGKIAREWIVEKLLMQAGVRLAGILNHIFSAEQ
jgi:hypothetical protein